MAQRNPFTRGKLAWAGLNLTGQVGVDVENVGVRFGDETGRAVRVLVLPVVAFEACPHNERHTPVVCAKCGAYHRFGHWVQPSLFRDAIKAKAVPA